MLWDDVADESTPEKLFFSRAFKWLIGTARFDPVVGISGRSKYIGDRLIGATMNAFHDHLMIDDATPYSDNHMLSTIGSKEFRFYKSKHFFQTIDSSEEMLDVLGILIEGMAFKFSYGATDWLKKYNRDEEYQARAIPSFSSFQRRISSISDDEIIKSLLIGESAPARANIEINFLGNGFTARTFRPSISDGDLSNRRGQLHQYDRDGARQLSELERLTNEKYRNTYLQNKSAVQQIKAIAGFPYAPTIDEYKRFLSKNVPFIQVRTAKGEARIKTSDLLTMSLFPVARDRWHYLENKAFRYE